MLEIQTKHATYCVDTRRRLMWRHRRDASANFLPHDNAAIYIIKLLNPIKIGALMMMDVRYPDGHQTTRVTTPVLSIRSNIHVKEQK